MKVTVDNRLRCEQPPPELADALRLAFTSVNPQHLKLKRMGYRAWNEPYHIRSYRDEDAGVLSLPRGGAPELSRLARAHGESLLFVDEREEGAATPGVLRFRHAARGYQEEIASAIAEKENLLVRAGAGAGKTVAVLLFAERRQRATLVVVWNDALKKQWLERLASDHRVSPRDLGSIQGKRFELRPVTVGMVQTMARLDDEAWRRINGYYGVVVMDEVQRAAASSFNSVIDRCRARYRVGISDSERRKDGKHFLVYEQFGKVEFEIEHEALVEAGHVVDVAVRVVESPTLDVGWYRDVYSSDDGTAKPDSQAFNRLMEELTSDEARNELVSELAIAAASEGPTLVFSHRVEHCRLIGSMLAAHGVKAGLLLGGKPNAEEFARTVEGLRSGALRVGVGTVQAVGTGIDLPAVSRGVVATPLAANKQLWRQVRGRINRPSAGKDDAVVYYVHDPSAFGDRPLKNLRAWNRTVVVFDARVNRYVEVGEHLRSASALPFLAEAE